MLPGLADATPPPAGHTRALLHFDDGIADSAGGAISILTPGQTVVPSSPVAGDGWLANGGGGLRISPAAPWNWGPGSALTLEAWVQFSDNATSQFVFGIEEQGSGVMRFGVSRLRASSTTYHWYVGPSLSGFKTYVAGLIQHIALSWPASSAQYPYYHIDGIDMGSVSTGGGIAAGPIAILIGGLGPGGMAGPYSFGPFNGRLDEMRASDLIRYPRGNFSPPPPPFELD